MRKGWLGILGTVVILLLGISIGTIVEARTKVQIPAREIELESFLEENTNIDTVLDPLKETWYRISFEENVTGKDKIYLIEFVPYNRMNVTCYDYLHRNEYVVELWIDSIVMSTRTIDDNEKILPVIDVKLKAVFETQEEMLEFQKSMLSAYIEKRKVSIKVYLSPTLAGKWGGGRFATSSGSGVVHFNIPFEKAEEE